MMWYFLWHARGASQTANQFYSASHFAFTGIGLYNHSMIMKMRVKIALNENSILGPLNINILIWFIHQSKIFLAVNSINFGSFTPKMLRVKFLEFRKSPNWEFILLFVCVYTPRMVDTNSIYHNQSLDSLFLVA